MSRVFDSSSFRCPNEIAEKEEDEKLDCNSRQSAEKGGGCHTSWLLTSVQALAVCPLYKFPNNDP